MKILAPAKINLALEVLDKREDGYHNVDMLMHSVNIYDKIEILLDDSQDISVLSDKIIDCKVQHNIAYRISDMFFSYTKIKNPGIKIKIEKKIPISAGLAGGSSDAAATLVGLDHIFNTNLKNSELIQLSAQVGADVPFCLLGGCAHATGIGTELTQVDPLKHCYLIIVKPPISISTRQAYTLLDSLKNSTIYRSDKIINSIKNNDLVSIGQQLFNRFEQVTNISDLSSIKKLLIEHGSLGALMSGSGPSVFGLFSNYKNAEKSMISLKKYYDEVFLCKPISHGVTILD